MRKKKTEIERAVADALKKERASKDIVMYSQPHVISMITDAVNEEREACANICEKAALDAKARSENEASTKNLRETMVSMWAIADVLCSSIRKRKDK